MDRRDSLLEAVSNHMDNLSKAENGEAGMLKGSSRYCCCALHQQVSAQHRYVDNSGCFKAPIHPPFYWRFAVCRYVSIIEN